MAASSIAMKLTLVALLCVAVALPIAQAVTCGQVASSLGHCVNYLKSGGNVPSDCCSGISNLNAMAKTTPDRQTACNCLKQLAGSMKPNPSIAAGLPGKCGINIPYPISASINCATIK